MFNIYTDDLQITHSLHLHKNGTPLFGCQVHEYIFCIQNETLFKVFRVWQTKKQIIVIANTVTQKNRLKLNERNKTIIKFAN